MDGERRRFRRINADEECVIFPISNRIEYPVKLRDISEEGLCFEIQADAELEVGSKLNFQFLSDVTGFDSEEDDYLVVLGEALVVRLTKDEADKLIVGCKLVSSSDSYDEYVKQVKVRGFIRMIRKVNSELD